MRQQDDMGFSRRDYARALVGAGALGVAGCSNESSGDGGGGSEPDGTATPGSDGGEMGDREAVDTIRYAIPNARDLFDWNPWTTRDNTTGSAWMSELPGLRNVHTGERAYSGTTVPTPHKPGHEEVSVMTWITGVEVEPAYEWWDHHDDRSTFWNGDPHDAVAREKHYHVDFFQRGGKFLEGETFTAAAESQWTLRRWMQKRSGSTIAEPTRRAVLEAKAGPVTAGSPLRPAFTDPYLERYRDAGSKDQADTVTDELRRDRVGFERIALHGGTGERLAGSGPYRLESMAEVTPESVTLRLDDEHPNADHTNVENLELLWAGGERRRELQRSGQADVGYGGVGADTTPSRETLPDHVQELSRWSSGTRGAMFKLNWHNEHLQRLWVRRALVEAVDWTEVTANGWGESTATVLDHDTFLLDAQSEAVFDESFLDALHSYSREANTERANQYMRRAGYSKQGGQWVGPNGNPARIELTAPSAMGSQVGAAQTIRAGLSEWGFEISFATQAWPTWTNALDPQDGLSYDATVFWHDDPHVFQSYHDHGAWDDESLLAGSPTADDPSATRLGDQYDTQGKPLVQQVPEEPGAFEAPDEAGEQPDLDGASAVNLRNAVNMIRADGVTPARRQELYRTCARYYNFYVPHFVFQQQSGGLWGNTRDFEWPGPDAAAFDYERSVGVGNAVVLGGLAQATPGPETDTSR